MFNFKISRMELGGIDDELFELITQLPLETNVKLMPGNNYPYLSLSRLFQKSTAQQVLKPGCFNCDLDK